MIEPAPSRDHTENMLRSFGCEIETQNGLVRLGNRRMLTGSSLSIPGDPSSAAFPIVAALIAPGSRLTVTNVMANPLRSGLVATLLEMGADLKLENPAD